MNDILETQIIKLCALNKKHFAAQDFLISEPMISIASIDSAKIIGNINRKFVNLCSLQDWGAISDLPEITLDMATRAANVKINFSRIEPLSIPLSPFDSAGSYINAISYNCLLYKTDSSNITLRKILNLYRSFINYVYVYYKL
jgi:hypothetical protein